MVLHILDRTEPQPINGLIGYPFLNRFPPKHPRWYTHLQIHHDGLAIEWASRRGGGVRVRLIGLAIDMVIQCPVHHYMAINGHVGINGH